MSDRSGVGLSQTESGTRRFVLLAGGGSGGHIFPNIAVAERLKERGVDAHFVVSNRPLDAAICDAQSLAYSSTSAAPLGVKPKALTRFARGFVKAQGEALALLKQPGCVGVIATGGFVSAPVARAAKRRGVPVALVSLDAVPGKANRLAARWAGQLFTTFETPLMPTAQRVGMPLRRASALPPDVGMQEAKRALGVPEDRELLLVTAGSQGLASTNQMMTTLLSRSGEKGSDPFSKVFAKTSRVSEATPSGGGGWHVLHLAGRRDADAVAGAYAAAGVSATVLAFCDRMGHAWRAASASVSLAGAGSVAEAWANGVPTVFFPYPYHRDQHQKRNAEPMVATGGAVLLTDTLHSEDNARRLAKPLGELVSDADRRAQMRSRLEQTVPDDGAQALVEWVFKQIKA